jgi:uncharacterized cupin superfamily protein
VVPEAPLERGEVGLVPAGEGWFVVNARDVEWVAFGGSGASTRFEGPNVRFADLGIGLEVLGPGEPMAMYHAEDAQEGFLVLSGEAVLIVEGQERPLRAWDFVHCPPWTAHVIVGAGTVPCVVLAVGARRKGRGLRYPADEVALRHGAGVEEETSDPAVAYAGFPEPSAVPCPEGLPDL